MFNPHSFYLHSVFFEPADFFRGAEDVPADSTVTPDYLIAWVQVGAVIFATQRPNGPVRPWHAERASDTPIGRHFSARNTREEFLEVLKGEHRGSML